MQHVSDEQCTSHLQTDKESVRNEEGSETDVDVMEMVEVMRNGKRKSSATSTETVLNNTRSDRGTAKRKKRKTFHSSISTCN